MRDKTTTTLLPAFALLFFAACSSDSPEQRLKASVAAMEEAIEARAPGDFLEHVSADFVDSSGRIDRQALRALLAAQMLGVAKIEVIAGPAQITLFDDRATLEVDVLLIGGRMLPERGEKLRISSGWRIQDGEWRCYTAKWERGI